MTANAKPDPKIARRRKRLAGRIVGDLETLSSLNARPGSLRPKDLHRLIGAFEVMLAGSGHAEYCGEYLRHPGRFLEHLHQPHDVKLDQTQLEDEQRDQQLLLRVQHMAADDWPHEAIAAAMRGEGYRITPQGIDRILAGAG